MLEAKSSPVRGGRAARRAARAAALPDDVRPIRPGMEGGAYRPLTPEAETRILDAAFEALETIGLADAPPSGIAAMTAFGATHERGRLRFSRPVVERALALAARDITLHGRDPAHDLQLSGARVHYGTAGAAVHVVDADGTYRESTTADLADAARLVERLNNVHFFQRPMVCRDIADNLEMDLNTIHACCSNTTKHVGISFSDPSHVGPCMELLHLIAGGEDAWRARPFVSNSNCFVVPPMKFATESCQAMEAAIAAGMPVLLLSAGQAGATAPAPLATAVVQAVAECLAGVVYVQAVRPGHPAVFGTWPFVSDLRTGAMSGGSGEQALLSAACAQMHRRLGLPGGAAAGMADAKLPDMQAGWEQAISNTMAGLAGLNMVYESVGMHASLLGFSLDALVLGDDMLGQVQRCVRGLEVADADVSLDAMRQVCLGSEGQPAPGHYLGHAQTLERMQRDYVYPAVADRTSPKEWAENGRPALLDGARGRREAILRDAPRTLLPDEVERAIRERWTIYG